MINTNNTNIQYRNYNRKSKNRPSSLILTVNRNNITEVKADDQGIPRRYSENSLNLLQQTNLLNNGSDKKEEKSDNPYYNVTFPKKVDKSSQTSLDVVDVSNTNIIVPSKSIQSDIINASVKNRTKSTKKNTRPISINRKRHSDHVPIDVNVDTSKENEEDTTVSINNILDAINDTMINTDSEDSDSELDTIVQNYNSNSYYYVRNQNQSLVEKNIKTYKSSNSSSNYPLTKSKSDTTVFNIHNTFSSLKSQQDIHVNSENIQYNRIHSNFDTNGCSAQFNKSFALFEDNNKTPNTLVENQSHKSSKNPINQQQLKEVNNHLNEHKYHHKVSQVTNANRQFDTNQSPLEENKAFIIKNNNYIDSNSNEEKVIEGSKYYCRMLPGDTRTLPRTSLGTRLSGFRKSKTLTTRKVSFYFIYFHKSLHVLVSDKLCNIHGKHKYHLRIFKISSLS